MRWKWVTSESKVLGTFSSNVPCALSSMRLHLKIDIIKKQKKK